MPTYDFKCPDCEVCFEEFQSITAKPLKKCPECGKRRVKRLIGTGSAVIFKGSGFYQTDYRSDGYQKDAKAAKDSSKKSDSADKKADSPKKPAADKSGATGKSDRPSKTANKKKLKGSA